MTVKVQLHACERFSRANGPGIRTVLWFQGCHLACPGCFNPETHEQAGGYSDDTEALAAKIMLLKDQIEGISITGGEPFDQPVALLDLIMRLHPAHLSILVFSGYEIDRIKRSPYGDAILNNIDVLIAGPYDASKHLGRSLLGSSNQKLYLLTGRYSYKDFKDIPSCEAVIHRDGSVTLTGIKPVKV